MKAREFANKMLKLTNNTEMRVLPGQLAFFLVMSIFPTVALIRFISIKLGLSIGEFTASTNYIPKDVLNMINGITGGTGGYNIAIFLILCFVIASNGLHSIIITSNEIYKIKDSGFIKRRIKAVVMTLIIVILFIFLLVVPVFGDQIFNFIKENVKDKQSINIVYNIYHLIKYPLIIIILYINIKLMYVMAPDKKIKSSSTTKGALFTTFGWIVVSELYSIYTTYFVRYDIIYGSISSILILLIWVYLLSYIFSLGLIINASDTPRNEIFDTTSTEVIKIEKKKDK